MRYAIGEIVMVVIGILIATYKIGIDQNTALSCLLKL